MSKPSTAGMVARIAAIAAALVIAPFALSSASGVHVNDACAADGTDSGTCCPEARSICVVGTFVGQNYYYKSEGSCSGN